MPRKIEIAIPVLVGSNGKWSAYGYDSAKNPAKDIDWGMLADNLDDAPHDAKEPSWPAVERRYIVRATVEVPDEIDDVEAAVVETVGE